MCLDDFKDVSIADIQNMQAAIIALYGGINTSVPLWVSGAIFIPAGFIALLLPIEPRGRGSIEI